MTPECHVSRRSFLAATVVAAVALPTESASGPQKNGTVQTVLGPLSNSHLGFDQSHEPVCCLSGGFWTHWPELMGGPGTNSSR
jgi:hypothetical protein